MPTDEQTRPTTPEEDIRTLYGRVARLNDRISALLDPAWGSKHGILPEGHPLHTGTPPATDSEQDAPTDWQAIAHRRERELKDVGEARHQAEQERDSAYRERAQLLALLATTHPAVLAPAPDIIDEPGWQILYLTIGGRQATWHIHPRDTSLFAHVEHVDADDLRATWDGHTTAEKYDRIADHITHRWFTPPVHYRRSDGTQTCVHRIPVGPDSCWDCRDLAGLVDRGPAAPVAPEETGQ